MCQSIADGGRRCAGRGRSTSLRAARTLYGPMVSTFTMELSDGVAAALDIARRAGNPLIVGGAVRDAALGADPKDIDIEVHGTDIEKLAQRYRDEGYRVDEVGKQFGVLKVSKKGVVTDLDVAVPRRENKVSAGHRGFEVSHDRDMTVTDAAERRDYTVNAILYDPKHQVIVDPFGGTADLKAGVLRHVSDKFSEDPLRVLRGVQMAGRFGMELHPDTAAVCRDLRPAFDELATERVQEEWSKLYAKSTRPDLAIKALQDAGWDDILPGLRTALANPDVVASLTHLPEVDVADRAVIGAALLSRTMSEPDREVFLHNTVIGKDTQHIAADLVTADPAQLDSSYSRKVRAYTLAKRDFTFDRYLTYAEVLGDEQAIVAARSAVAEGIGAGPEQPMIQGRDVITAVSGARKPGPWVGELVDEARDRQYRGEFTDRDAALAWVSGQPLKI